jgi:Flp pilus assembly protein TadG
MAVEQRGKGRRGRGERGQSLVELTLTLPVLLLLLVGVAELGNSLNAYMTVVDAGRDGARLGAKGPLITEDQIKALVLNETDRLPNQVQLADITVTRNVMSGYPNRLSIRVTVCYDHSLILGVPLVTPDPIRMCSTTTMPVVG